MTKNKNTPGQVVDINSASGKVDARKDARREAKARTLQKRFTAARREAESKTTAAERLKKVFRQPGPPPPKKP